MKWFALVLFIVVIAPVTGEARMKARSTSNTTSLLDSSSSSGDLAALPDVDSEQTTTAQHSSLSTRRTPFDMAVVFGAAFDNYNGTINSGFNNGFGGFNNANSGSQANTAVGFTAGLLGNYQINEMFSMETGLYYSPRNFSYQMNNNGILQNTKITANMMEIPIMARVWFAQYFSLGFGPYIAFGVGNVNVDSPNQNNGFNNFNNNQNQQTGSISYQNAGMNSFDFGILGSAQAKVPVANNFFLLVDGRFNFGLSDLRANQNNNQYNTGFNNFGVQNSVTNISSSTTPVNTRSFRVFAGAGLGF